MFCSTCGAAVGADQRYCANCGAAVAAPASGLHRTQPDTAEARISALRHPKESAYFVLGAIAGVLGWLLLIWLVILFFWMIVPVLIGLWVTEQFCKAQVLGNSIRISPNQYPHIHALIERHAKTLGMSTVPLAFVQDGDGALNAFALKFLRTKYVFLNARLVDAMLAYGSTAELSYVIGHELGHHAAGHTALWKTVLLRPAMVLPFFGTAYSRACELTADRIGMYLCGDKNAACRGLATLACGSAVLSPQTDLAAFKAQEKELPALFAFIHDLYSSHPRTTMRVLELEEAAHLIASPSQP